MRTNHIILTDAIADLNERAPHVIGSNPLWSLTSRSFGFEVLLHLPDEYAGLDGTSTGSDVTWIMCDGPEPIDAINEALAELAVLNARLAEAVAA